ncbi:MAG: discoidin domain-containing protein, partial [Thermoanaerobaculia bacterium]
MAVLAAMTAAATASAAVLDDFESIAAWSAHPSDGVELRISQDEGLQGKAMRLDFDFHGGAGYAIARRNVDLSLPANWELAFSMKAVAPVNNLEFKLVDPTGDNVWWVNRRMFEYPREWQSIRIRKRQVEFAWGPLGGGEPHRIAAIEIVITAGTGGKGTVWIDNLTYTERPPVPANPPAPHVTATAHGSERVLDAKRETIWRATQGAQSLTFDFTAPRELGGLIVDWSKPAATDYDVEISDDASAWTTAYRVRSGNGGRDFLSLPDTETRYLRLRLLRSAGAGYAIREVSIEPATWSGTPTEFFSAVARAQRRGLYPRYFYGEQSYWTITGADGDDAEALINEDGAIEPFAGGFSIEPFLLIGTDLVTWNDVEREQTLAEGYLPIPSVTWRAANGVKLTTTALTTGKAGDSTLLVRYRVTNGSSKPVKIALAIRPFQVNPPWQFLGTPGGASRIRSITYDGSSVTIDGSEVIPITKPSRFRAANFDQAEAADLVRGRGGDARGVTDERGVASAVLTFDASEVVIAVPLSKAPADAG